MAQSLYEVHTLKSGQWVIDSTYPDRESSIEVAKSLHGEKRFDAIKVIKDTFDPKSESSVKGTSTPTKTNADGVQLSSQLPQLGKHADKMAIIRGMNNRSMNCPTPHSPPVNNQMRPDTHRPAYSRCSPHTPKNEGSHNT